MTGYFAVDKPEGFTSFDVVAKLRGIIGIKKIGHGGTLDPMATGVLPIFVGKATKAADILPDQTKRYVATGLLGVKTNTGDVTGEITERRDYYCDTESMRRAALAFLGKSEQIPPMYSAVRINGKHLYEIARKGIEVERQPRPVEIFSIDLLNFNREQGTFCIDVHCTRGTYIRTLIENIAGQLETVATMQALRRIKSGPFDERDCVTITQLQEAKEAGTLLSLLRPIENAFSDYPQIMLNEKIARQFLNGVSTASPKHLIENTPVQVWSDGIFLGLAESRAGKLIKTCQFV